MSYKILKKQDNIFTTSEIKEFYTKINLKATSANYFIREQLDLDNIKKIQNGLYYKVGTDFDEVDINSFFKNKNTNDFSILTKNDFSSHRITNEIANLNYIFVIYRFYSNNKDLFDFIKKNELSEVKIISSKLKTNIPISNYSKVFLTKYTNFEDEEYKWNAHVLIKDIPISDLTKIAKDLKFDEVDLSKLMEVYYYEAK